MKQFQFRVLMIAMLFLVLACGSVGPVSEHMLLKDDPAINVFNIKPEKGKAALVVAKTTRWAAGADFPTYLDKKLIGVNRWKSYFVKTDVEPAVHYVIAIWGESSIKDAAKINFESKRVYYIQESPWNAFVGGSYLNLTPLSPEDLSTQFDASCRLVVYDINTLGDNMSDKDYQEAVNDYEREVKKGHHKENVGYKGVPAK